MSTPESAVEVIRVSGRAAAVLHPTRLKLLGELSHPNSASGLARRLGLPRQRVNYHLRALERERFVELVEERRRGNCVERVVRATARSYLISSEALGALGTAAEPVRDRFSAAYLIAAAARAIRDLARLRAQAEDEKKRLSTLTLETEVRFATAGDRNAFAEELAGVLASLAARYHDESAPKGRPFRFFVGGYPVPRPEEPPPGETTPNIEKEEKNHD